MVGLGGRSAGAPVVGRLGGFEPRHLAALVAVGETGTFRTAGERLGYVQSAVSQQIAQLERSVGMPLIERAAGQPAVTLTEAGAALAEHAAGILAQLDAAAADLRAMPAGGTAQLRLGVHDRTVMRVLPQAIDLLGARAPDVRLVVRDSQAPPHVRACDVRRGVLDAALEDLPLEPGPFASVELFHDPIVLAVPRAWPLAARAQLGRLDELASVPLVADTSWPMLALVESQLRAAGVEPRFAVRSPLSGSVQALVAAGIGAALLPALAVDDRDRDVAVVGLGDLLAPRRIALYWHAHRRRLRPVEQLADALAAAFDDLAAPPARAAS
jgi:DNA-binding transcriptional LysR family regulator